MSTEIIQEKNIHSKAEELTAVSSVRKSMQSIGFWGIMSLYFGVTRL